MNKLFALVEGAPFTNEAYGANTLASFTSVIEHSPEFISVFESYSSYPSEGIEQLKERITRLVSVRHNPNYMHPYDAAIAVYLYLIHKLSPAEFRDFVSISRFPSNLWWSKQMITVLSKLVTTSATSYVSEDRAIDASMASENVSTESNNAYSIQSNIVTSRL